MQQISKEQPCQTKHAGVNLLDYGLPNEAQRLHEIINTRVGSFEKLIKGILEKSKMLQTLEELLKSK